MENVKDFSKWEIKTVYKNILVDVYDENPYKIAKTEEGLDLTDTFINPDSGQVEEKQMWIECARVIEAGPDCEFVCSGDDVLVDIRTMTPIPFMGKVYWLLNEQAVKAVIAEGLTERFNK